MTIRVKSYHSCAMLSARRLCLLVACGHAVLMLGPRARPPSPAGGEPRRRARGRRARRAFDKAEDGVHFCEERFLEVARRCGVLGLPQQRVTLEEALATHASHVRWPRPRRCARGGHNPA